MSQKTNPTSLRLHKNNQNFSGQWFSDFFFTENYHYGSEIEKYLASFLRQTQYSKAFFSARNQYKNFSIFLFLQDCRADRKEKQLVFKSKSFSASNQKSLKDFHKTAVFQLLNDNKNGNRLPVLSKWGGVSELLADRSYDPFSFQGTVKNIAGIPNEKGNKFVFDHNKHAGIEKGLPKNHFFLLANQNKKASVELEKRKKTMLFQTKQKQFVSPLQCHQETKPSDLKRKQENTSLRKNKTQWIFKKASSLSLIHLNSPNEKQKYCQQLFHAFTDHLFNSSSFFSSLSLQTDASLSVQKLYEKRPNSDLENLFLKKEGDVSLFAEQKIDFRESLLSCFIKMKQRDCNPSLLFTLGLFSNIAFPNGRKIFLFPRKPNCFTNNKLLDFNDQLFLFLRREGEGQQKKSLDLIAPILYADRKKKEVEKLETTFFGALDKELRVTHDKAFLRLLRKSSLKNVIHLISSGSPSTKVVSSITQSESCLNFFDRKKMTLFEKKKSTTLSKRQSFKDKLISLPFLSSTVTVQPIRFIRDRQNVMSLLDQIVILLERRVAFRQIKSFLFKEVAEDSQIKGVRFVCSGRLGGRSKKAQKAKVQCASWGQTSLSAFSSKLLFGSKNAYTSYGQVGIKLWVCFKNNRC